MRHPKHTRELNSYIYKNALSAELKALEEAKKFLAEYKRLCNKYKCIVDASVGYPEITPTRLQSTIDKHCEELKRLIISDIRVQHSALEVKDWTFPIDSQQQYN